MSRRRTMASDVKSRAIVNDAHTPADAAGVVFDMVRPRMAGMWHCQVVDGYIDPVFEGVRKSYSGAVTLCQDLTVFNVTPESVSARQAIVDPVQQAVIGPSTTSETIDDAFPSPAWWAGAAIDWQSTVQ